MADYISSLESQRGGFLFDNFRRNEFLLRSLYSSSSSPSSSSSSSSSGKCRFPSARKTGTTICGVVCDSAVVLGADTRATQDTIVADKNCSKLHRIANNIYCAGAGTSADLDHTTGWLESKVELFRMNSNTQPRVGMVVSIVSQELFKYQGYKGCALVLGGVDITGPSLYSIHPHGSTDRSPFISMGSGSLNALAVLESSFKDNMTIADGKSLVSDAIRAGIMNDLGSGGSIDICIITREGTEHVRSYEEPNLRSFRLPQPIKFSSGTTPFLREKIDVIKSLIDVVTVEAEGGGEGDHNDVEMSGN